jgi:predicted membrane metal-binding protein
MTKKIAFSFLTLLFFSLFVWWFLELTFGFFTGVDGLGFKFHKTCIEFTQNKGPYDFLNLKVLCSYNMSSNKTFLEKDFFLTFLSLGLIHLLVASGTHLLIINHYTKYFFSFFTSSKTPNFVALFIFVLFSNFCCPVTRSLFQLILTQASHNKSLSWSKINLTFMSSIIYLLFFPHNILTLSFWLSVSASLCLALFSTHPLLLSFAFYVVLYPYISDFTPPSITALVINIIITPTLGPLLIWNSILYVFFSIYRPIGDFILSTLINCLKDFILNSTIINTSQLKYNLNVKFFYGFLLIVATIYFQNLKSKKLKKTIHDI